MPTKRMMAGGGLTSYYVVQVKHPQDPKSAPYQAEAEDLIEALDLSFDEGNILKELFRKANERKGIIKPGTSQKRSAEKMHHSTSRILRQEQQKVLGNESNKPV